MDMVCQNDQTEKTSGRLPDFFVIGAAKSGTTSLYSYLFRHPRIFLSRIKEPEYFSKTSAYDRGIDWYKGLFSEAGDNQRCGEASTTYTRWPHTLDSSALIAKTVPDAKFIYIMRHPVERAYSHYAHHMRSGITMTFEEALSRDNIYVDCSMYMKQIERYLRFFPRQNFLFLFHDQLRDAPQELIGKALEFLVVRYVDLTSEGILRKNIGGVDHFIRSRTTVRLRRIAPIGFIAALVPKYLKDKVYEVMKCSFIGRRLQAQYRLPSMNPETRMRLLGLFEKSNRDLEKRLELELPSSWYA